MQFGAPKEYAEFWLRLRKLQSLSIRRAAAFIDDNPKVLAAARTRASAA